MSFIGNAIFGGASAYNQGKAQQAANNANAISAREQSQQIGEQTALKIQSATQSGEQQLGSVRAAYGANGIQLTGSAAAALGNDQNNLIRRLSNIGQTGAFEQSQLTQEAAGYATQANYAQNAANWGAITGVAGTYGGISTYASGFGGSSGGSFNGSEGVDGGSGTAGFGGAENYA